MAQEGVVEAPSLLAALPDIILFHIACYLDESSLLKLALKTLPQKRLLSNAVWKGVNTAYLAKLAKESLTGCAIYQASDPFTVSVDSDQSAEWNKYRKTKEATIRVDTLAVIKAFPNQNPNENADENKTKLQSRHRVLAAELTNEYMKVADRLFSHRETHVQEIHQALFPGLKFYFVWGIGFQWLTPGMLFLEYKGERKCFHQARAPWESFDVLPTVRDQILQWTASAFDIENNSAKIKSAICFLNAIMHCEVFNGRDSTYRTLTWPRALTQCPVPHNPAPSDKIFKTFPIYKFKSSKLSYTIGSHETKLSLNVFVNLGGGYWTMGGAHTQFKELHLIVSKAIPLQITETLLDEYIKRGRIMS